MKATRDWIPPSSHTCPNCGRHSPTRGWCDDCKHPVLDGQTTIYDELGEDQP
jgi:hypothetical protein